MASQPLTFIEAYFLSKPRLLRKLILLTAVTSEMSEARDRAVALFTAYKRDGAAISPNLRWMAYSAGVRHGDLDEWRFAWHKYTTTQVPSEKSLWMRALADSSKSYILQRWGIVGP